MPNATSKKPPRRTAERILEVTLELFNRFGEPNVSTTLISAELKISPGNLYYHYPAKEELINALFGRYEKALDELLRAADGVRNVEDAWLFFHMPFELKNKGRAVQAVLGGLARGSAVKIDAREAEPVATAMVVVLTYWLSYEYVCNPRKALEPESASAALARGAYHVLSLLMPYLEPPARDHLHGLVAPYRQR
jgi:AcrR family transcriptional regulator